MDIVREKTKEIPIPEQKQAGAGKQAAAFLEEHEKEQNEEKLFHPAPIKLGMDAPTNPPPFNNRSWNTTINFFQKAYGNLSTLRHFNYPVQAKLTVGQPNDVYEQEADRVAEQVMKIPGETVGSQQSAVWKGQGTIQRKSGIPLTNASSCKEEDKDEQKETIKDNALSKQITPLIWRREERSRLAETNDNSPNVTSNIESHILSLQGNGQPLPETFRSYFEPRFGHDFSDVRIHDGVHANETARAIDARAFTMGNDIIVGKGQLSDAPENNELLAHELTHVVQQAHRALPHDVQRSLAASDATRMSITPAYAAALSDEQLFADIAAVKDQLRPLSPGSVLYEAVHSNLSILKQEAASRNFIPVESVHLEDEKKGTVLDAQETRDAIDFEPIETTPFELPRSVEIPWGEKYSDQFRQLEIEIGERSRTRAITIWAMDFFEGGPPIEDVATALTKKVDDALFAINRLEGLRTWIEPTTWFDMYRKPIDAAMDLYLERSLTPWLITYRIPRPLAVAVHAVEDIKGKCEEHAFLTVYLLSIGHMIQKMPFGQLAGDIYYTGVGMEKSPFLGILERRHAMVILVKGDEFKDALKASIDQTGSINARWLCEHTDLWGPNAWIVDGWTGKAKKLSDNPITLDWTLSQEFRRNPRGSLTSEWDVTVDEMANRVARAYGIQ
jgi:hypothetical protein